MSEYIGQNMQKEADSKIPLKHLVMPWCLVEDKLPPAGRKVLATYKNSRGNDRIIIASRLPAMWAECGCEYDCDCEYDEKRDCSYYPAGWYEQIENWDEFTCVRVYNGEITHWMPLPASVGT